MREGVDDSLIVKVLEHYFPDWEPLDGAVSKEWVPALCPFHGESRPSAGISYENDAFKCHACDASGSAISIIMREEGMTYRQAVEYAERISPGSNERLSRKSARKPGRRTFGESGAGRNGSGSRDGKEVPSRIRGRTTPWT